jgi:hypothetical protein
MISSFVDAKMELELDGGAKRKAFGLLKKELKEVQKEKKKISSPSLVDWENILREKAYLLQHNMVVSLTASEAVKYCSNKYHGRCLRTKILTLVTYTVIFLQL